MCKEDCQATKEEAKQLRDFIQKYRAKWDQLEIDGDEGLREAFADLGRCVRVHYVWPHTDLTR